MTDYAKRITATVSLQNIEENYTRIGQMIGPDCEQLCIVKADAYGHGAVPVANRLQGAGARHFAVATVDEGLELRDGGITGEILVLGYTPPAGLAAAISGELTLSVPSVACAREISREAELSGRSTRIHIQADTGMGRLGFSCTRPEDVASAAEQIARVAELPGLLIEGLYTHLSDADRPEGKAYTQGQFENFLALKEALKARGISVPRMHCANSAATLCFPEMRLSMCRPGLILYGCPPDSLTDSALCDILPLKPAMRLSAAVVHVHQVPAGGYVSYGRTFRAEKPCRVAVVAAGYADGVHRAEEGMEVLIHGCRVPVVGRVCMDMFMADVTALSDVRPGDECVLFGAQESGYISVEEQAAKAHTVNYELLCAVSKRVPRRYI